MFFVSQTMDDFVLGKEEARRIHVISLGVLILLETFKLWIVDPKKLIVSTNTIIRSPRELNLSPSRVESRRESRSECYEAIHEERSRFWRGGPREIFSHPGGTVGVCSHDRRVFPPYGGSDPCMCILR